MAEKRPSVFWIVVGVVAVIYFVSQAFTRATMPDAEKRVCDVLEHGREQYQQASGNEIAQAAAVSQRAARLGVFPVEGWIADVDEIETSVAKGAFLSVIVPCSSRVRLRTWNNFLSDASDRTMIAEGSSLLPVLATLRRGQRVVISAELVRSAEGRPREISVTSAGSMLDPEFLVRFTAIKSK